MNVNDSSFGPLRPAAYRPADVDSKDQAAAPRVEATPAAERTDRIEISQEAREASASQDKIEREVEFARRALYSMPPLSEERAEELVDQLRQGHYNAPDVLLKLSERLSNEIAPRISEAGGETS